MNLRLLQLGDSALPIGGYSHSWGLEAAVNRSLVHDAATLEQWVRDWLYHSLTPLEGVVVGSVAQAVAAEDWQSVFRANELLWLTLTPPTLRHASRDMGEQLWALASSWSWAAAILQRAAGFIPAAERPRLTNGVRDPSFVEPPYNGADPGRSNGGDKPRRSLRSSHEWHHAPVFAILAAAAGSAPEEALTVYLHQAALGMIGAGVRAIPIGHTHGQEILTRLHGDIRVLAREYAHHDLETAGSFAPAYDILCYAQAHLHSRLFRS